MLWFVGFVMLPEFASELVIFCLNAFTAEGGRLCGWLSACDEVLPLSLQASLWEPNLPVVFLDTRSQIFI